MSALAVMLSAALVAGGEPAGKVPSDKDRQGRHTPPALADAEKDPDVKKLGRAKVAAARNAYEQTMKALVAARPGARPEDAYTWSVRWLQAQRGKSLRPADHIDALDEHLKRMRRLAKRVDLLLKVGVPELPAGSAAAVDFYVAEAELWLAEVKANAKKAET